MQLVQVHLEPVHLVQLVEPVRELVEPVELLELADKVVLEVTVVHLVLLA